MAANKKLPPALLWIVLGLQVLCTGFFLWDMLASTVGLGSQPLPWRVHEFFQLAAGLGLLLGVMAGAVMLRMVLARNRRVEDQLRAASGAFADLMEERFAEWGLTAAERDVAIFTMKGFSNGEIAALRETREGTVKAQCTAIYRKAGVHGRAQLISLFIEDLMAAPGAAPQEPAEPETTLRAASNV
ncbi:helix-turn-helix transcriptional regulator [Algicella marina]|uniref:Helix-turn-helix transcriptional regulator n=1 Tax=Algicella marina TaxID=2683284 RepID=A0A6P1T4V8_9RHOB|nr:LuxR C-terminal-related transcriptional regulator [Algicella marina]QHQ37047.1 helix-turn-helix transcriptional regulator [Algicella marina]